MEVTTRSLDSTPREPLAFDDRARRVLDLRKQVREGTYRPDPREVAAAILAEWVAVGDVVLSERPVPAVTTAEERRAVSARFVVEKPAPAVARQERTA